MGQERQSESGAILVVDDEPAIRTALCEILKRAGHHTLAARDGQEALGILDEQESWLVLADLRMPRLGGLDLLREVKRRSPDTHVVLISGYASLDSAIEAVRLGASDYLLKPFDCEVVEALVARLGQAGGRQPAPHALPGPPDQAGETHAPPRRAPRLITEDPAMTAILQALTAVAASQATILLQGESGTGKEILARHIHSNSARSHKPFVAVNCAALPDGLLESELFGYERGAFTGAVNRRPGRFEQAHGGTLLLDEISEISLPLQAKLLRVIQEREVDRLGGKTAVHVDIRIIATTNRPLRREVEAGRFREDLYYRLNVFPVTVPPLRERPRDIAVLARHFLRTSAERNGKASADLAPETEHLLLARPWRGNVRELENVIERAILLANGGVVLPEHIALDGPGSPAAQRPPAAAMAVPAGQVSIWEMERDLILRTLQSVSGNRTHAAKILDISIRTLRNKLREYRQMETGPANSTRQCLPCEDGISLNGAA